MMKMGTHTNEYSTKNGEWSRKAITHQKGNSLK